MRVAFRVDASIRTGSGHVMRCLALAERLRVKGVDVLFVCRELAGNLIALIEDRGIKVCRLDAPQGVSNRLDWNRHASWLEVPWQQDADETLACLKGQRSSIDWLVVDHYALDWQWEARINPAVGKIMVIDDLADRAHDCELLLDQNLYANQGLRYAKLVPSACEQLLGPIFAQLRPEFTAARQTLAARTGQVERILVFMGGSDPDNATGKVLDALEKLGRFDIAVDLVVGQQSAHRMKLEEHCQAMPRVSWHENVADMASLMARADLAIGAGGSATWERCCLGLPALVVSIAENQVEIAKAVDQEGVVYYLGTSGSVTSEEIRVALEGLMGNAPRLVSMSAKARCLVDGRGTQRVVAKLENHLENIDCF